MLRSAVKISTRFASENAMKFSFASASKEFYSNSTSVTQVDLPTGTGMMGILPNHVPTLGVLAAGWATVYDAGQANRIFVSSGSYTIKVYSEKYLPPGCESIRGRKHGKSIKNNYLVTLFFLSNHVPAVHRPSCEVLHLKTHQDYPLYSCDLV